MRENYKYKLFVLYLLLVAGGIWHILGFFQELMRITSGPLLILLSLWLFAEHYFLGKLDTRERLRFAIWSAIVFISSFLIEAIGVKTGLIFGSYDYGPVLIPQVSGVPVAIGSAWLIMLMCSAAVTQRYSRVRSALKPAAVILLIALLMLIFDILMEPAAIKLNYWTWQAVEVPMQNYLAWFFLGLIYAALAHKMEIFKKPFPDIAFHAYLAQFIYFILVILS